MKMRYMAILYTAILLGIAVFMFQNVSDMSYESMDMVEINQRHKSIEQRLQLVLEVPEELTHLEQEMECTILLRTDKNYQRRINEALMKNAILLDY